jgi:hypothetical protein
VRSGASAGGAARVVSAGRRVDVETLESAAPVKTLAAQWMAAARGAVLVKVLAEGE